MSSACSTDGVAVSSKSEQGHTPVVGALAERNDQVPPEETGLPRLSVPWTSTSKTVSGASAAVGSKVIVLVVASYDEEPWTAWPPDFTVIDCDPATTGLLNRAVMLLVFGTLEAPGSGDRLFTPSADSSTVVNVTSTKYWLLRWLLTGNDPGPA